MSLGRILAVGVIAVAGCRAVPEADTGFVSKWTEAHYALARAERLSPPVAARATAYAAVALYEGWAGFSDSLRTMAGQLNGLDSLPKPGKGEHDRALVALEAQTVVLRRVLEGGFGSTAVVITALHDSLIAARTAAGVSDAVRDRSLEYGTRLGQAIVDWADQDGFEKRSLGYTARDIPGSWIPTVTTNQYRSQNLSAQTDVVILDNPTGRAVGGLTGERSLTVNRPKTPAAANTPGINPTVALEPGWSRLRTFALGAPGNCAPPEPVPFSTEKGSPFWLEADSIYRYGKTLTPEQKRIAYFWADNPGESGTPAGHWMSVIAGISKQWNLSPERTVEAYALTALAVADAFIGCWEAKFRTDVMRPVTYINEYIDPEWQPLLNTPPFPTYTSGHSTQSSAAAEVLTALFGDRPYDDDTHVTLGHPVKRLPSFKAAADEAGRSRWYGGIHFPMDHRGGQLQGSCIGRHVLERVRTRG